METIDQLLDKVEMLPPSPALLSKLMLSINDVDANFDEVVNFIEVDPALTAKLLQICNSAFFGAAEPIVSVRAAVNHAGYQAIYLLVSIIKGSEAFKLPASAGSHAAQLWKHSITTAYAAKFVAEAAQADAGAAFTGGLLHDIGKIVLMKARTEHYKILLKRAADARTSSFDFEVASHGYSHAEVGAALLASWKLPQTLINSIAFHHNPASAGDAQAAAACIYLGNVFAHDKEYDDVTDSLAYKSSVEQLMLGPADIELCLKRVRENWAAVEQMCWLA